MKIISALLAFCLCFAVVAGQRYFFGGQFPSASLNALPQAGRDPRQNRGPVTFPASPPDAVDETSGVIVGASGFGFVPPQQTLANYYSNAIDLGIPNPATYVAYNYFSSPYSHRFSLF